MYTFSLSMLLLYVFFLDSFFFSVRLCIYLAAQLNQKTEKGSDNNVVGIRCLSTINEHHSWTRNVKEDVIRNKTKKTKCRVKSFLNIFFYSHIFFFFLSLAGVCTLCALISSIFHLMKGGGWETRAPETGWMCLSTNGM